MIGEDDLRESPSRVPRSLRTWFVVHFAVDMIVGIPLFLAPVTVLGHLGWDRVDPVFTRLFAAALLGIGLESLLGRNAGPEAYKGMLNLKIVWSLSAALGIGLSMTEAAIYRHPLAWSGLVVFVFFHALWVYWRIVLQKLSRSNPRARP